MYYMSATWPCIHFRRALPTVRLAAAAMSTPQMRSHQQLAQASPSNPHGLYFRSHSTGDRRVAVCLASAPSLCQTTHLRTLRHKAAHTLFIIIHPPSHPTEFISGPPSSQRQTHLSCLLLSSHRLSRHPFHGRRHAHMS